METKIEFMFSYSCGSNSLLLIFESFCPFQLFFMLMVSVRVFVALFNHCGTLALSVTLRDSSCKLTISPAVIYCMFDMHLIIFFSIIQLLRYSYSYFVSDILQLVNTGKERAKVSLLMTWAVLATTIWCLRLRAEFGFL